MILRKLICRGVLFLLLAGILISCAPIYNMSGLKKLDFSVPEDWQNIKNPDDCTYDYAFRFYNDRAWFEIYLRTVYVPRKNSVQWLEEERKNAQRKGYSSSDITLFTTKAYTWHLLETEDAVAGKQQKIPVRIRHFVAKEEKSPRLIQCELVGEAGSFAQLPAGPVNAFLDSIVLHPVTLKDKPAADYENYVVSAEEEAFLLNGQQLISEEQYARAISLFTSLLNRPITRKLQSRVQVSLGESYLGRGIVPYIDTRDTRDFQEAIQQAKKGLDLRRDDWLAYTTIGAAYLNLAEYAQAKQYLKKALKYCPKADPSYPLIQFYYDSGQGPLRGSRLLSKIFSQQDKIQGIVYDDQDPGIIVSGSMFHQKDTVSGYTVMKITRDRVYLKLGYRVDEFLSGDIIPRPLFTKKDGA